LRPSDCRQGWEDSYRLFDTMNAGDFSRDRRPTGMTRQANVVAEQPTTVLQVPSAVAQDHAPPEFNRLF
jgi:hypothetical protein